MSDLRKKSGVLYLAIFLFLVCGAAATLMTVTAVLTESSIEKRQVETIREALNQVLPPFEFVSTEDGVTDGGLRYTLYTAWKSPKNIAGYAVRARTLQGYGGEVEALVGFQKTGEILRIVVTAHNETPGLGSKVMDRKAVRRLQDLFRSDAKSEELPPNAALDSYIGKSVWEKNADRREDEDLSFVSSASKKAENTPASPHAIRRHEVQFVSGATVSSQALLDLVNRAADILRINMTRKEAEQ